MSDDDGAAERKWIKDMRAPLMLLASLGAFAACWTVGRVPGGYWRDDAVGHQAGQPIMLTKFPLSYAWFTHCIITAFVTSLLIGVMVMSERFYRRAALMLIVLLDVGSLVAAFVIGTSPGDPLAGLAHLLAPLAVCLLILAVAYIASVSAGPSSGDIYTPTKVVAGKERPTV